VSKLTPAASKLTSATRGLSSAASVLVSVFIWRIRAPFRRRGADR
jgi:hypothetical protein